MKDIQEEHVQLSNVPLANDDKTQVLIKEISDIKSPVQHLTELYQELMKICQQKRDLFIVAVKFHMAARQVRDTCNNKPIKICTIIIFSVIVLHCATKFGNEFLIYCSKILIVALCYNIGK